MFDQFANRPCAQIDYDAVAKVYNINKGATSKRFSRLKIALDAATEATTNGKDDTLEASKSPEGTKRKALTNSGEDTGKKRKAKAAVRGSKKKKAKIEEAVGEDEDEGGKKIEDEGGKNIKAEEGSEDDALDLSAEIDPFYD